MARDAVEINLDESGEGYGQSQSICPKSASSRQRRRLPVGISNEGHANAGSDGSASAQSRPSRRLMLTFMNPVSHTALRDAFQHCRDMNASLKERLDTYSRAVRQIIPPYADAVEVLIRRLMDSGVGSGAPGIGDAMPPFILPDENGCLVSLEQLIERGPIAVMFHRGHWCPWCRISIHALVSVYSEIAEAKGQVVCIMPDRAPFAIEFKREASSPFPVLIDMDNGYALSLNLAIWIGPDLERLLTSYGRALPDYQGNDSWMLPIPATFVVGRDGIVRARFLDPDFRRRMTVEELLDGLKAAQ
jgi:peroxiredoxin